MVDVVVIEPVVIGESGVGLDVVVVVAVVAVVAGDAVVVVVDVAVVVVDPGVPGEVVMVAAVAAAAAVEVAEAVTGCIGIGYGIGSLAIGDGRWVPCGNERSGVCTPVCLCETL